MAVPRERALPVLKILFQGGLRQASPQDAVWTSVSPGDLLEELEPREMFALARLYRAQANQAMVNRSGAENTLNLLDIMGQPGPARGRCCA